MYETIRVETPAPDIGLITLSRPHAANALNTQMGLELYRFFEEVTAEPSSFRCLVLTGEGEKAFCAGGDLKERRDMSDADWLRQHLIFERMYRSLLACPLPLIAAINGAAYGGGCEMAAACDFVYAAETARFAMPEAKLGIIPGGGGTQTFSRAVGERRAKEVILTGRPFTAADAYQWGLVNAVLPSPAALMQAALAVAAEIAANAPLSVRAAKRAIHQGLQGSLHDGLAYEIEAYNPLVSSTDRREGVLAFHEKRTPRFRGA